MVNVKFAVWRNFCDTLLWICVFHVLLLCVVFCGILFYCAFMILCCLVGVINDVCMYVMVCLNVAKDKKLNHNNSILVCFVAVWTYILCAHSLSVHANTLYHFCTRILVLYILWLSILLPIVVVRKPRSSRCVVNKPVFWAAVGG